MSTLIDLGGEWTMTHGTVALPGDAHGSPDLAEAGLTAPLPDAVTVHVPGSVHTGLLDAGLIVDPYEDDNEKLFTWIGRTAWAWERSFDVALAPGERASITFAGLDTFATVFVNDHEVATSSNQHVPVTVDVTDALRPGGNTLRVAFAAPYAVAEARKAVEGPMPNAYDEPFQYIRKTASNFGWDWGPTLVTSGIWRPVTLEIWQGARIQSVLPAVGVDFGAVGDTGRRIVTRADVTVVATAQLSDDLDADATLHWRLAVTGPDGTVVAETEATGAAATLSVDIPSPELWWPRGYGDQPLYQAVVSLTADDPTQPGGNHRELARQSHRFGIRTTRLETTPDAAGTPFTLVVNEVPIWVRGLNWIPDDCFPTRVGKERYARRIEQAIGANANLLRVWGGGTFEDEAFYEIADEQGVLVSQDFLFACAAYPETEPQYSEVVAEVRANITRLAWHPSLALWFGGNETIWGYADWGWKEDLAGRQDWGIGYYQKAIPQALAELDPTRPYWPSSPWSGSDAFHPNDPANGSVHIWDVWNQLDYTAYRDWYPRFVAEFGYQAPATWATLADAIGHGPDGLAALDADSALIAHHQKAADGQAKLARGIGDHLGELTTSGPEHFDDWLWATQLLQARAVTTGIEYFRSLRPHCMGTIWWQINDCWPALSWAVIDSAGREKPAYFALRAAYRDRLTAVEPTADGGLALIAVNETDAPWVIATWIRRLDFDGRELAAQEWSVEVAPRGQARIDLDASVATPADAATELIVVGANPTAPERTWWFFAEDKDAALPQAAFATHSATVIPDEDGSGATLSVVIEARSLIKELAVFPDRLWPDATVDTALISLLPGESATLTVRHLPAAIVESIGAEAAGRLLTEAPVLRTANDIQHL